MAIDQFPAPDVASGSGLPDGGTIGQVVRNTAPGEGEWDTLTAADVGADPAGTAAAAVAGEATARDLAIATAVAALVASSPAALNTLKELADALGDDPNFATTVAAQIGTKLSASAVSAFALTLLDDADANAFLSTLGATAVGKALLAAASEAAARTAIGAEQAGTAASAVATHEADTTNVHGIADTSALYRSGGTDVAVADGGTGASTAAGARTNLDVPSTGLAVALAIAL